MTADWNSYSINTMRVWTIQPEEVASRLENGVPYRCVPEKSELLYLDGEPDEMFTSAYNWMVRQLNTRVSPPPPGVTYPVWSWMKWHNQYRKPDLRYNMFDYARDKSLVIIELDVEDDLVLPSDFSGWHSVLNNSPLLNYDELDELDIYWEELSEKGLPLDYPEKWTGGFKEESWERIFDIHQDDVDTVQVCFWEITPEQVIKVYRR